MLIGAAMVGACDMVRKLINTPAADVNAKDADGWTPLMGLVRDGHTEIVKTLIAAGADVNAQAKCIEDGNPVDGWTPLMLAATNGHTEIVKTLIAAGADVNAKNADGWTPLMWGQIGVTRRSSSA